MTNLDSILKSRDITANIGLSSQSYSFSSSSVWMWELDYKESWVSKNWCFWTVVLEKTLESPLDCKEIQPVHPKGNQSWIFIGRTDAEAETPILWPLDAKNWLIAKDPDVGKDWRGEGDHRGWNSWMASLTWWTWVWVSSWSLLIYMSIELVMPCSGIPFSSCLQSFPASGSFQMSQIFASGGQSTGVSALTSVLPMNTQDWSPLEWTGWISLKPKGLSRVFSNTTVQKHQLFSTQLSL